MWLIRSPGLALFLALSCSFFSCASSLLGEEVGHLAAQGGEERAVHRAQLGLVAVGVVQELSPRQALPALAGRPPQRVPVAPRDLSQILVPRRRRLGKGKSEG